MKQEHFCGTMQRVQGYWDLVSGKHLILKYESSCFQKQTNFVNPIQIYYKLDVPQNLVKKTTWFSLVG